MVFKITAAVSWASLGIALVVAQVAFETHEPTTLADPAGQAIFALEMLALASAFFGHWWDRRGR